MSHTGRNQQYLRFTDEEIGQLNPKGLGKLLYVRREVIFLKTIMQQVTETPAAFEPLLTELGVTWLDYLRLMSKRLRRVLKAPRVLPGFEQHTQLKHFQGGDTLELVNELDVPFLVVCDFDRTITNKAFLNYLQRLRSRRQNRCQLLICSAHGDRTVIQQYCERHGLPVRDSRIYAMGSVREKQRMIYRLALSTDRALLLYFDDEQTPCHLALLFGYHPYLVQPEAKGFIKPVGLDLKTHPYAVAAA